MTAPKIADGAVTYRAIAPGAVTYSKISAGAVTDEKLGFGALPLCIAKTQKSLSDDPQVVGRPEEFDITVRDVILAAGAGTRLSPLTDGCPKCLVPMGARPLIDYQLHALRLRAMRCSLTQIGRYDEAREFYDRALRIRRDIGDRQGEGAALGNLGLAYADLGEVRRAIGTFEQALTVANDVEVGLSASVVTRDLKKAMLYAERIEAGVSDRDMFRETGAGGPVPQPGARGRAQPVELRARGGDEHRPRGHRIVHLEREREAGGELRKPVALTLDPAGAVLVYDGRAQKVLRYR